MGYYIVRRGRVVKVEDMAEWAEWVEDDVPFKRFEDGGRRVEETVLPDGTTVSTVFLGIDHNHSRLSNVPILFETMIHGRKGFEDYQERYPTVETARAGHAEAVKMVLGRN